MRAERIANDKNCENIDVDGFFPCLKLNTCFIVTFHQPQSECVTTHAQTLLKAPSKYNERTREEFQTMKCRTSVLDILFNYED